jgi:hemerythrin-like domain-containing protein
MNVRSKLVHDHEELDAMLVQLAEEAEDSDRPALQATWNDFEAHLIAHINAEERYLLPLIETDHADEVARTLQEHAEIRDLIAELGLAIELHTARQSDICRLVDLLRAHAKHEESALYTLAGDKASLAVEHSISSTLKAAVRSVFQVTSHDTSSANHTVTRDRP